MIANVNERNGLSDSPFSRVRRKSESLSRFPKSGPIIAKFTYRREIVNSRVATYHFARARGDTGRTKGYTPAIYTFKLCLVRASVLIFEGSKARQEKRKRERERERGREREREGSAVPGPA